MTHGKPARSTRTQAWKQLDASLQKQLKSMVQLVSSHAQYVEDNALMNSAFEMVAKACGGVEQARLPIMRRLLVCQQQRDELLAVLKSLRQQKPTLAWVVSGEFTANGSGRQQRFVFASPLARGAQTPECYAVVDEVPGPDADSDRPKRLPLPQPPFLGLIEPMNRLFLGPAADMPSPPLPAEILPVVASRPNAGFDGLGEIEISDKLAERSCTLFARRELAEEIRQKMDEDGETVHVRSEAGVATAIHKTDDHQHEDWEERLSIEGPSVFDLIQPSWMRREWSRDIRNIALGRPVRVVLIGPTGTGKTTAAERVARDAFNAAAKSGNRKKGIALIRISSPHIGSSFIHQTERNLFRAFQRSKALAKKGYIVTILCDEADALFGEMDGSEHAHNRSERLAAQSLLTDSTSNVACYCAMNNRRNSWLPAALERRFLKRVYDRSARGQIEAVALLYVSRHPSALRKLKIAAEEFAGALADNLFSDERIVATVRHYSGVKQEVRLRDLHNCSPGKVEDLINVFCCDVTDGVTDSIDELWNLIDREFRVPNLNPRNVYDLTFLKPLEGDTVRSVELAR